MNSVPHFYEKSASVVNLGGDITVGSDTQRQKKSSLPVFCVGKQVMARQTAMTCFL
jgi:hypothetical protein